MLVLPMSTAPAARSAATMLQSPGVARLQNNRVTFSSISSVGKHEMCSQS